MIKLILVEDDELFALDVQMMLEEAFEKPNILHFKWAKEVPSSLEQFQPDIMLVDMILEDEKASLVIAQMAERAQIPVIFMTAYKRDDLFRMAMKVNPYNFLHKPFKVRRLRQAIELAISQSRRMRNPKKAVSGNYILLKGKENVLEKVDVNDIYMIEAFGNYCHLYTTERRYTHRMPLKRYGELISSDRFVRIHRNFVINIEYLDLINTREQNVVLMGQEYPLSHRYKSDLLRKFPKLS